MKHDIIGRVLKILRIEKRPGDGANSIFVEPKFEYSSDPSVSNPYTGLEIPHWQYIEDYINNLVGGEQLVSRFTGTGLITLDWQNDVAPDIDGAASDQTYFQAFGNAPVIQVWLEVSANTYSLEVVPVTQVMSAGDIDTITIDTSGINAIIIIK